MNPKRTENSSDYEPISNIEDFNSLFNNNQQDSLLNSVNHSIDKGRITIQQYIVEPPPPIKCCDANILYDKLSDLFIFFLLFLISIYDFVTAILNIFELGISLYSVILMNYVFFISSIVSYTMAPIYKFLSSDWLNFFLSFAQVILASPLIAFYIFFIVKSVIALGEIVSNFLDVIKSIFGALKEVYKRYFVKFLSMAFKNDYQPIFNLFDYFIIFQRFFQSAYTTGIYLALGYVLFFLDKCIIILGAIDYASNIIRIIVLLIPSYIYFVQTIFNIKCKKIKFVIKMIKFTKIQIKLRSEKSGDSSSSSSDSSEKLFKELDKKSSSDESEITELKSDSNEPEISDSNIFEKYNPIKIFFRKLKNRLKPETEVSETEYDSDDIKYDNKILFSKEYFKITNMFLKLLYAEDFFALYYYSTSIAFDRYKQYRKRIAMIVFFILNLLIIIYDIIQLSRDYSDYLLSSIIVRFLLVPLFSYYNIVTVSYHKAKDKTLRIVNFVSIVFTIIIAVVILAGFGFTSIYNSKYRINDLGYQPPNDNITIVNEKTNEHLICSYQIYNISAFELFGYALGGYDVKRNETIFKNQMKIFFGENYTNHISYNVYELDKYFLFLKFYDSTTNSHIFAFRGYNSGPEIAFQFELFASKYIIPFFEDNVPFLESINEYWLGFYTDFLNSFGLRFFENRNLIVKYVKSIRKIYADFNFNENDTVIFTGINCGGVLAKVIGTLEYRKSISFISFPMEMDFLKNWFHFTSSYESYVTNVFNVDGFFSHPDSDYAINIGIDTPVFFKSKFCTSDFCDIFSKMDNIYRTFCTMSETCGRGNQFNYYCMKSIGEKDLKMIREGLQEDDD